MSFIGNILWLTFGGFFLSIGWYLAGMVMCLTIIGIPMASPCFKIGKFIMWPFGTEIKTGTFGVGGMLLNIIWILLFGWELFIGHVVAGLIFCVTIVGIPFGVQHFKLAQLSLVPFGSEIVDA